MALTESRRGEGIRQFHCNTRDDVYGTQGCRFCMSIPLCESVCPKTSGYQILQLQSATRAAPTQTQIQSQCSVQCYASLRTLCAARKARHTIQLNPIPCLSFFLYPSLPSLFLNRSISLIVAAHEPFIGRQSVARTLHKVQVFQLSFIIITHRVRQAMHVLSCHIVKSSIRQCLSSAWSHSAFPPIYT